MLRVAGNADADRDVGPAGAVGNRLDRGADPAGDLLGRLAWTIRQDHRELVAAVAIRAIALADARLDGAADADEELVPGGVAISVVEPLEPIEVHHQDGDLTARP